MSKLEDRSTVADSPVEKKQPERAAARAQQDTAPQEAHVPKHHNKPVAYAAFHLTNFFGFHVLFNSTVSLLIAYNLLPTKPAKATMEFLAKVATPVNAFFSKITTPIFKFVRGPAFQEMTKEEVAAKIAHSARSRVETAFMCIAGFIALWPVKALEDHRAWFMNTVDRVIHPFRSKEERKAQEIKPEDTPKETWGNLIRARIIGLAAVFTADALQQRFNNYLTYEKGNIDTGVWKWGANTFDKMSEKVRDKFVEFFTRKKITLSGIQSDMLPHLLRTIDGKGSPELHVLGEKLAELQGRIKKTPDKNVQNAIKQEISTLMESFHQQHPHLKPQVERAIFAEQSRLLITKELFLTLLISTVIYICAKTPIGNAIFEKARLKKKEPHEQDTASVAPAGGARVEAAPAISHVEAVSHTKGREPRPIEKHKKINRPAFTERLMQEAEMANTQQLTV